MITIDEIMQHMNITKDQDIAAKFGRSIQAVSNWRREGMVPASIERMFRDNYELRAETGAVVAVQGDNHYIDIKTVAETPAHYSPMVEAIIDVVKEWPEKKTKALLRHALEMDEKNGGG